MSVSMTREEVARSLIAQGVSPEKAHRAAEFVATMKPEVHPLAAAFLQPRIEFPVRLVLPWSALCPDNERDSAGLTMRGGKPFPRKVMTARYRDARSKIIALARDAMSHEGVTFAPLVVPLSLVARVYVPTQRRVDVSNFCKGVHDAMSKIVYTDDNWLYEVRWVRVGMDMDRPRAEVEVAPL